MKVLGRAVERSRQFLEDGESVQRAFIAQGGLNPWALVGFFVGGLIAGNVVRFAVDGGPWGWPVALLAAGVALALMSRRVVLVTDRAVVVVLAYGRFGPVMPKRVVARLPRQTPIGPLSGTYARVELGGERLWIHKKFHGSAAAVQPRLG